MASAHRFELTKGTSNKFWEIERDGSRFTTHWGRIGTTGQVQGGHVEPLVEEMVLETLSSEELKLAVRALERGSAARS